MNLDNTFARLPLKKSAKIVHGDALEVELGRCFLKNDLSYIIGNPPFYIGPHNIIYIQDSIPKIKL